MFLEPRQWCGHLSRLGLARTIFRQPALALRLSRVLNLTDGDDQLLRKHTIQGADGFADWLAVTVKIALPNDLVDGEYGLAVGVTNAGRNTVGHHVAVVVGVDIAHRRLVRQWANVAIKLVAVPLDNLFDRLTGERFGFFQGGDRKLH